MTLSTNTQLHEIYVIMFPAGGNGVGTCTEPVVVIAKELRTVIGSEEPVGSRQVMTGYGSCMQVIAGIGSAVAAIAAAWTARNMLAFQKHSLLKKTSIEQIVKVMQRLHALKSLTQQAVLEVRDDEFIGLEQRIKEALDDIGTLQCMVCGKAGMELEEIVHDLRGLRADAVFALDADTDGSGAGARLDAAIGALHRIYEAEAR